MNEVCKIINSFFFELKNDPIQEVLALDEKETIIDSYVRNKLDRELAMLVISYFLMDIINGAGKNQEKIDQATETFIISTKDKQRILFKRALIATDKYVNADLHKQNVD
jgi:hypothetical protein